MRSINTKHVRFAEPDLSIKKIISTFYSIKARSVFLRIDKRLLQM